MIPRLGQFFCGVAGHEFEAPPYPHKGSATCNCGRVKPDPVARQAAREQRAEARLGVMKWLSFTLAGVAIAVGIGLMILVPPYAG